MVAMARPEAPPTPPPPRRDPAPATPTAPAAAKASEPQAPAPATTTRRASAANAGAVAPAEPAPSARAARTRPVRAAGPPRVELDAQPAGENTQRAITYTARVSDAAGQPVQNATVTLHGWMPNGSDVETALGSTGTPGTYRGTAHVGPATPGNLRVRVVHEGTRFEIPSGR